MVIMVSHSTTAQALGGKEVRSQKMQLAQSPDGVTGTNQGF